LEINSEDKNLEQSSKTMACYELVNLKTRMDDALDSLARDTDDAYAYYEYLKFDTENVVAHAYAVEEAYEHWARTADRQYKMEDFKKSLDEKMENAKDDKDVLRILEKMTDGQVKNTDEIYKWMCL